MKFKTAALFGCLFITQLFFSQVFAQTINVSGKVTNKSTGEALAGATVSVKGTRTTSLTDDKGNFSLSAPSGAVLTVSFIGMTQQEVTVSPSLTTIDIELEPLPNSMNEVVVVGYGTQKRSVITGAISSVKARDLEKVPSNRIEQSLQGRVAGVTIAQNSGQPGSPSTIRIRGLTTFGDGNNNPLWVVDGVVVDQGGIGYINQSDIESIEVLKDAASAAIYGTRAATGVILVTTKKGRAGKFVLSYNGFYGVSSPARKLDLLNASQYAAVMNERAVNDGGNLVFANPDALGTGTDWQDAIFYNDANRYSHEISFSGGSDKSTFFFSFGIQDQEGIVAKPISNYNKKTLRLNSTHKISKIFSFGQTVGYAHQKSVGLGNTNSEFGGPLSSAINLDPTTPLVITDPAVANTPLYQNRGVVRDANGNPYGISTRVGQEMTNPLAYMFTRQGGYGWSDDFVGNAYLEAAIPGGNVGNFRLRTTVGAKLAYWGGFGFTPIFYLSPTQNNIVRNSYNKSNNNGLNWNIENTLNYSKMIGDHDLTVLLGQGTYVENIGGSSSNTIYNLPVNDYRDASFRFNIPQSDRESGTSDMIEHKIYSLFARVNYSYQDKYLFTGIIRRDGSTRFGLNKKYGVFPGVSVGWNVSNEEFWKDNNIVSRLKLRGNYGVVGNDNIRDFGYAAIIAGGYNYTLGWPTQTIYTGYAPLSLENPDLHWEETSQVDVGFEALLFSSVTLNFDWYKKRTTGILRQVNIPGYVGVSDLPVGNVATMDNTGVELELGYSKTFGQFHFSANGNLTYLKNNVVYVARDTNFIGGDASFQTMGAITRTQVGHPYNAFWGYQSDGVFQNQAEIDAHKDKNGQLIQPNAKPGDFRWLDLNGDGRITNDNLDKTFLGSSFPKYTFGLTLNLDYKSFDFMVFLQGTAGSKVFQGLRRLDIGNANYQTRILGRWTGDGTTNENPRLTAADPNGNYSRMSDYYLEKGDYTRLKLVQIGYSLPTKWINKIGASRLRVYFTGENLLTITGYTGYDPEIGGMVLGLDRGVYPQARSFLGGVQLQF
ncbi:MAG TPA: TonB-dependent receptor [Chitinophagaceae bacterium]